MIGEEMTGRVGRMDGMDVDLSDPMALTEAAGRRYWRDAEFSRRVKIAVAVAERGQPDDGFDRFHKDSVVIGAAVALHSADLAAGAALAEARQEGAAEALEAAREYARNATRTGFAEKRGQDYTRHWAATASWLNHRRAQLLAGEEPSWPDAAYSTCAEADL